MYIPLCGLLNWIDKTQLLFNVSRIIWSWTEHKRIHTESFMIRTIKSKSSRVTYKHASSLSPDEVDVFLLISNYMSKYGNRNAQPGDYQSSSVAQAATKLHPALPWHMYLQSIQKKGCKRNLKLQRLASISLKGSRKHLLKNQTETSKRTLPQEMLFPTVELWSPL